MIEAAYRGSHVQLEVVALAADETRNVRPPPGQEEAIVLLEGAVELGGEAAKRSSVFDQRASAVYLPPGSSIEVYATSDAELALIATHGYDLASADDATFVRPDDVVVQARGEPGWQRDVHDVIADAVPARHLLVGETFNEPGQWSSFPPHKHDGADGEPRLEEVYHFRIAPPHGFAHQSLYTAAGECVTHQVRDGDAVLLPYGYHPVSAPPGYRVYYLWALAGDERHLVPYEDPQHRWIHDGLDVEQARV